MNSMPSDQSKTETPAPVGSTPLLADVAMYLACDGSYGMYDARSRLEVLPRLEAAVGLENIQKARQSIIDGITANDRG
jgi:hypothetical protein